MKGSDAARQVVHLGVDEHAVELDRFGFPCDSESASCFLGLSIEKDGTAPALFQSITPFSPSMTRARSCARRLRRSLIIDGCAAA
jgi:hypothetical protein